MTSLLSLALAVSVGSTTLATPAFAANRVAAGAATAAMAVPASVLGLDGDDTKASAALTGALRRAFETRGFSGGEEISLVEMRLTMGCDNLEPACMAEGGEALSVEKLVYGNLQTQGEGQYQLDLQLLDVTAGRVINQTSEPITADDLKPDTIDARALTIADTLLGIEEETGPDEVDTPVPATDPTGDKDDEPKEGKYWFGRDKDGPGWKKAGLGVGLGLTVVSIGLGVGFGVVGIKKKEEEVTDAVIATEDNPAIAIDRTARQQDQNAICDAALENTDPNDPDAVYNEAVGTPCRAGRRFATVASAAWVGIGVGVATTAVFSVLLLVHKKKPGAQAMKRHQLRLGAAPSRGGAALSTSFKF